MKFFKYWLFNSETAIWRAIDTCCIFSPAAKTQTPSHQVLHIILMGVLHQHINSHYCSTEPAGVYNDKFLSVEAHLDLKWRSQCPTHTSAAPEQPGYCRSLIQYIYFWEEKKYNSQMSLVWKPGNMTAKKLLAYILCIVPQICECILAYY